MIIEVANDYILEKGGKRQKGARRRCTSETPKTGGAQRDPGVIPWQAPG